MKKNLSGSIFAGIWLGCIFGLLTHMILALFLASKPYNLYLFIPKELWDRVFFMTILCGLLPGFVLGFCGGLFAPFNLHPGSFSELIGAAVWITCTGLTWFIYWDSVIMTNVFQNSLSIFITFLSFLAMYRWSEKLGRPFEKFRYNKK